MKKEFIIISALVAILFLFIMSAQAQADDLNLRRKMLRERVRAAEAQDDDLMQSYLRLAARGPYRKVDGQLYDLTPRFRRNDLLSKYGENSVTGLTPCPDWEFLIGKVSQITPEGILFYKHDETDVTLEKDSQLVFIKNFPKSIPVVDDSPFALYAVRSGRHSYTSTQGATKTVYAYDYGQIPTEAEIKKLKEDADSRRKAAEKALENQRSTEAQAQQGRHAAAKEALLKFYQPKAEAGDGFAQLRLGEIYLHGEGVETNVALARKWLSTALTNGYPQATNLLTEIERNTREK